ncbi:MAG: TetR/AcrR family transcriptional regulator [Bacteroidales bacterium]|jgi:AcrR family transcriptional regulator|nr:TetR/AcrR family transcriptional regulator [Bacteroidales bacterium]
MMSVKERVLAKAAELFIQFGVKNVTMDQLATELSMSKRTLYEYFGHKDQLIVEAFLYMIDQENQELLKIMDQSAHVVEAMFFIVKHKKKLRDSLPELFWQDLKRYLPQLQQVYLSKTEDQQHYSAFYILLERGVKEGIFRKEINLKLVDQFMQEIIAIVKNSPRIALLHPKETELSNNIFIPYFRGICTAKGLRLIQTFFEQNLDIHTTEK